MATAAASWAMVVVLSAAPRSILVMTCSLRSDSRIDLGPAEKAFEPGNPAFE
jgi:hypothetical protein